MMPKAHVSLACAEPVEPSGALVDRNTFNLLMRDCRRADGFCVCHNQSEIGPFAGTLSHVRPSGAMSA